MIQVKSLFNGWTTVNKETAKELVIFLLKNITTMRNEEERINYINKNKIKGTTVQELIKC